MVEVRQQQPSWLYMADPACGTIACPRDGFTNSAINIVCANENCEQHLARWPSWFDDRWHWQVFINALRSGALVVALAIGLFHWAWTAYAYAFLLVAILLALMLREYPNARRRTSVDGIFVFGVVGVSHFAAILPINTTLA